MMWRRKRIYVDYAAATPVRKEVLKSMAPYWSEVFGNASAIHSGGVAAKKAINEAREKLARTLRVRAGEIIFTSGGTESNNLALKGAVLAMQNGGVKTNEIEIISTAIEHPSITKTLDSLAEQGCIITVAPVDQEGQVIIEDFKKLLSPKTRLVSVAYVNSEIGVIQDISKISRIVKAFEKENGLTVLIHTDASQAPLWLPCALDSLGVDLLTLDAGKCEGPKGAGVLVRRQRASLMTLSDGGPQEADLRPGTEPTPLLVGCVEAICLSQLEYENKSGRVSQLRDQFIKELETIPGFVLNGHRSKRVANNVNVSIAGLDTEFAVVALDTAGISASTKSACSGAGSGRSAVVYAMTNDLPRATATIRFTLSPNTTLSQLRFVTKTLKKHIKNSTLPN